MDNKIAAKNIYLYYYSMLGYPGAEIAIQLANKFTGDEVIKFGKYEGNYLGEIILLDPQYIQWLLENTKFTLSENATLLYDMTKHGFYVGGYTTDFLTCDSYIKRREPL